MTPKRLIVADPGLRNALGHHFSYSISVAEAARERGILPLVLASASFTGPISEAVECRPIFTAAYQTAGGGGRARAALFGLAARLPAPLARSVAPPLRVLRRNLRRPTVDTFAAELASALAVVGDVQNDLVLLHSVSAANIAGLASALRPSAVGALALILRRTPREMDRDDAAPQPIFGVLRALADHFGSKLLLLADTAPLTQLWSAGLGLPVAVAPLPVVAPPVRTSPPAEPPHLVFVGGARAEKGYALLPRLVRSLAGAARFTLHSGAIGPADDPMVQRAHRALHAMVGPGLRLLERPLEPEEYGALLAEADLLLLPYDAASYGPRSSGILAEARAIGVPAVVPAGCWMADEVGPDPALVFAGGAQFEATVRSALPRLPLLLPRYAEAAPEWRAEHSPASLMAVLLGETRPETCLPRLKLCP